ncbi:MAG: MarR family transcriptional regulator [Limnospira sp.]
MKIPIAPLWEKVRAWFPKARDTLQAHADGLEAKFNPRELDPIPRPEIDRLQRELATLVMPASHQNFLRSELEEQLKAWLGGAETSNNFAVLGCPAEAIATILWDALTSPDSPDTLPLNLTLQWLPWSSRPLDHRAIASELQKTILQPLEDEPAVVVIPDLSWCFLRCTDGFDGIDRLKEAIFRDRSRFWLVGCNRWAWLYLDRVCELGALFEKTVSLPPLVPIALKDWLEPVCATLDLQVGDEEDSTEEEEELEEEEQWASLGERRYYHRLAGVSQGISAIAARAWLESLGIAPPKKEESEHPEEPETTDSSETEPTPWILSRPSLPSLPSLSKDERFLLFSLTLHGAATLPHLALSLGVSEREIHTPVRRLIRAGVILRPLADGEQLQLNPMHYPRLKRDLDNNKFLIGGDD